MDEKGAPRWIDEVRDVVRRNMQRFTSFMKHQVQEKKYEYKEAAKKGETVKRNAREKVWGELGKMVVKDC